jgi:bifunctional UDP-N-acetylglucosamine pyrophosphorylase/glucosamine-1-phosphate N-acetyltransferase
MGKWSRLSKPKTATIPSASSAKPIVASWSSAGNGSATPYPSIQPDSISNEYYLTDLIAMAVDELGVGAVRAVTTSDLSDAWGVNDRRQLATAEALLHDRTCARLLRDGVTITNPALVTIEPEVTIAADCVIQPGACCVGRPELAPAA